MTVKTTAKLCKDTKTRLYSLVFIIIILFFNNIYTLQEYVEI